MSSSSSAERGRGRWGRWRLPVALATIALLAALLPAEARQATASDPVRLEVEGASLADLSTSGLDLTPAFSPATTDYVLRCRPGVNTVGITLAGASGTSISVGALNGPRVSSSVALVENQALVIDAPGPTAGARISYWIRCLPSDFPALTVTRPGTPPPGWYLTGNIGTEVGSATYAMILDSNGTPVWYQRTAGQGAINVTPVAKNVAAWASDAGPGFGTDPNGAFSVYNLTTQQTRRLTTTTKPLDFHEFLPLENGNYLLLASPLRAAMNLRSLNLGPRRTIVDCVIEEVSADGRSIWKWRASNHVGVAESLHPFPVTVDRQRAYDVFHCNSVDQDPDTGDLLLSLHNTDAIYRIKKSTSAIIWKLGGNAIVADGEQRLKIRNDPERTFHGQHDARFLPDNDISLFDNHTWYLDAARGVEYHVDTQAGSATLDWQYQAQDGGHSAATGSFRRYHDGNDNLIAWGFKPHTLFTEVDKSGNVLLNVALPDGQSAYRTVKTPPESFDADLLRQTAGLPPDAFAPAPRVYTAGVATSGPNYGSSVTIIGSDLKGATSVKFGSREASSFTVESDSMITAVAPEGSRTVGITVTTPGGSSGATPTNALVGSDGAFSGGAGSWKPNVNASVALSSTYARSRPYSLAITARSRGLCSAVTSPYQVAGNAVTTGSLWARAARGHDIVRSALIFYDARGLVIWITQGRPRRATDQWVRATVTGISPAGAATVALAVDGIRCRATLLVDDAAISGRSVFAYRRAAPGVSSIGPDSGSGRGGTAVTIVGSGLSAAKAVYFGTALSPAMTIGSDSSITAESPPGSGTVAVVVSTRTGTRLARPSNVLRSGDSNFENGPASWVGNVNASTLSGSRSRSGRYSLVSRPSEPGYQSVISGTYPAAGGSIYSLVLWVSTQQGTGHARPFMTFYGRSGAILSIEQGPVFQPTSSKNWTKLRLDARSPEGATGVAVGVDDADGRADVYIDDVTLAGSTRFTYR